MRLGMNPDRQDRRLGAGRWKMVGVCAVACLALMAALTLTVAAQNSGSGTSPGGALRQDVANMPNPANQPPDANSQMRMREQQQQTGQQSYSSANAERKKQIADDSAKLLKLATDLKAEVDKTTKDTLSLGVIRKAEEIEKLARAVKDKMKLTPAAK